MFLEAEGPGAEGTHGQAAGCVVCEQHHPREDAESMCVSSVLTFPAPLGWVGPSPTVRWADHGLYWGFQLPCSYRRRHRVKCKWVEKQCIVEQGAFQGCQAHPRHMHGTGPCQSTTSGLHSPKCQLSPGVDSVSVDLELDPEAGAWMPVWGPWPQRKGQDGELLGLPGTMVPHRPHCGET